MYLSTSSCCKGKGACTHAWGHTCNYVPAATYKRYYPLARPPCGAPPLQPTPPPANLPMTGAQAAKMATQDKAYNNARAARADMWTQPEWNGAVRQHAQRLAGRVAATRLHTAADAAAARLRGALPEDWE